MYTACIHLSYVYFAKCCMYFEVSYKPTNPTSLQHKSNLEKDEEKHWLTTGWTLTVDMNVQYRELQGDTIPITTAAGGNGVWYVFAM